MTDIGIGRLAELTGVKVPTIRFYEQHGLLAPPSRTDSTLPGGRSGLPARARATTPDTWRPRRPFSPQPPSHPRS